MSPLLYFHMPLIPHLQSIFSVAFHTSLTDKSPLDSVFTESDETCTQRLYGMSPYTVLPTRPIYWLGNSIMPVGLIIYGQFKGALHAQDDFRIMSLQLCCFLCEVYCIEFQNLATMNKYTSLSRLSYYFTNFICGMEWGWNGVVHYTFLWYKLQCVTSWLHLKGMCHQYSFFFN